MNCKVCGVKANSQYCWKHKKQKPLKKTPIKKISEKGKIRKEEKKELLQEDWLFYDDIWHHRLHICEECEKWISDFSIINFHHVLFKSQYPQFRHEPKNVILLCDQHHHNVHFGVESDFIKEKVKQVKKLLL